MCPPVRFSSLKHIARSPAHYRYALEHPTAPTDAMLIGTVAHSMTLVPWREVAIWDGPRRAGKEWEAFRAEHAGQEIIRRADFEMAREITEAVHANADAAWVLGLANLREEDIAFRIGERDCGVRPDAYGPKTGVLVELKTTNDASPARFPWHATRMGYAAQIAWQIDGLRAAEEAKIDEAYIVAVETKAPFVVQVYEVTPASIDFGRRTYRMWWERLMVCESAEQWPGYLQTIAPLEPPDASGDFTLSVGGEEVEL